MSWDDNKLSGVFCSDLDKHMLNLKSLKLPPVCCQAILVQQYEYKIVKYMKCYINVNKK